MKANRTKSLTAALLLASLYGCNLTNTFEQKQSTTHISGTVNKTTAETLKIQIQDLQSDIKNIIDSASCTNSNQCGALPMGNKACGGPSGYLPYSTIDTNTTMLFELSAQHQQKSRELNQLSGMVSDCAVTTEPTYSCRANRCQK